MDSLSAWRVLTSWMVQTRARRVARAVWITTQPFHHRHSATQHLSVSYLVLVVARAVWITYHPFHHRHSAIQ